MQQSESSWTPEDSGAGDGFRTREDSGIWDGFRAGTWQGSVTFKGLGLGPRPWEAWEEGARSRRRDFRIWSLNGLPVVTTPGELDIDNCRQLTHALLAAGGDATIVIADMTATTFVDGTSLSNLMRAYQRLQDNGIELRVATFNARVRWLMAYLGDDRRLRIFDTLPEAITAPSVTARTNDRSPHRHAA